MVGMDEKMKNYRKVEKPPSEIWKTFYGKKNEFSITQFEMLIFCSFPVIETKILFYKF